MNVETPLRLKTMTTLERNQLENVEVGSIIYNSTTDAVEEYTSEGWDGDGGGTDISVVKVDTGIVAFMPNAMISEKKLVIQKVEREMTLPIGIPYSQAYCDEPPILDVVLGIHTALHPLYDLPTQLGTITFTPGSKSGVFHFPAQAVIGVGNIIYIESPLDTGGIRDVYVNVLGYSLFPLYKV